MIDASSGISSVRDTSRGRGVDGDIMEYVIVEMDIHPFIYTYFYLSNSHSNHEPRSKASYSG